jgi:hypothetical protein
MMNRRIAGMMAAVATTAALALGAAGAASAQHEAGDSLVNVQIGDVTVQVPVSVAANICDVNVNVLAEQVELAPTTCEATADSVTVSPSSGGSDHEAGDSLVNLQIGDVTVQVPISVAANICDVDVNVLSAQINVAPTTCEADADSIAA